MRIFYREKAPGLSLLYFLKAPVFLLLVLSLLFSGCGSKQDPLNATANAPVSTPTASTENANNNAVTADPKVVSDTKSSNDAQAEKSAQTGKESNVAKVPVFGSDGIIPRKIHIPSLGIEADVISLGLTKDGAMDVPKNDEDVAWFAPGYRPGTPGHAVLAGHVDSKTGPAVFYKLNKLGKGDEIILTDKAKNKLTFKVISTAKYPYQDAPLEDIFGPSDSPLLNVITCTGAYSRSEGTHQERLVVTAELIS